MPTNKNIRELVIRPSTELSPAEFERYLANPKKYHPSSLYNTMEAIDEYASAPIAEPLGYTNTFLKRALLDAPRGLFSFKNLAIDHALNAIGLLTDPGSLTKDMTTYSTWGGLTTKSILGAAAGAGYGAIKYSYMNEEYQRALDKAVVSPGDDLYAEANRLIPRIQQLEKMINNSGSVQYAPGIPKSFYEELLAPAKEKFGVIENELKNSLSNGLFQGRSSRGLGVSGSFDIDTSTPSSTPPILGNYFDALTGRLTDPSPPYPFGGSIFDQPTSQPPSSWLFRDLLPLRPNPTDVDYRNDSSASSANESSPTIIYTDQMGNYPELAGLWASNGGTASDITYGSWKAADQATNQGQSTQNPTDQPIDWKGAINTAGSAINTAYNVMSFGSTLQDVLTGRRNDPGAYLSLANSTAQGLGWLAKTDGVKDIVGAIGDLQDPLDTMAGVTGGAVAGWGLYQNIAGLANGEVNAQNVLGAVANSSALKQTAAKPPPARALALAA